MKTGKLDSKLLEDIVFRSITYKRPEVLVRPGIGEDCAVVDFGEYHCVLSTDPITGAVNKIGKLAVTISCNDIASNGVEPLGLLLACLLPEGTTVEEIKLIMEQAGAEAERLGVEIIGGHTEITAAVNQPVIVSTAIGRTKAGASGGTAAGSSPRTIVEGDHILMTKTAGLEGTGILALDFSDRLSQFLDATELEEAKSMMDHIDVIREGILGGKLGASAMHDVTEGGILGAIWEICQVGGVGARINKKDIPVSAVTTKICSEMDIDPLRLISSGSLLIVAGEKEASVIVDALDKVGIPIADIGRITEAGSPVLLTADGQEETIGPPERDELYKVVFAEGTH